MKKREFSLVFIFLLQTFWIPDVFNHVNNYIKAYFRFVTHSTKTWLKGYFQFCNQIGIKHHLYFSSSKFSLAVLNYGLLPNSAGNIIREVMVETTGPTFYGQVSNL